MKITDVKTNPVGFKSSLPCFVSSDTEKKFSTPPEMTIDGTNGYFLELDKYFQCIPSQWNYIYSLDIPQREDLVNLMRLTFKTHTNGNDYIPTKNVKIAKTAVENVDKLIKNDEILSEKEVKKVYEKTSGCFEMSEIINLNKRFPQKIEASKENLKFIKDLTSEENQEFFEAMSPRTIIGILLEENLDYDFYTQQLKTAKEDDILSYPEDEIRNTINNYFLGKDIPNSDAAEKFDKQVMQSEKQDEMIQNCCNKFLF